MWVDREPLHIRVYADESLINANGGLTEAGRSEVRLALASIPGAPTLESAKPCH
ncbi:hypothetical protein ACFC0S_17140 [Streptomyces sp. NPDC056084]|uniref:hypothetical protein n=1 Tax=unclassified Streptomyces TaxID=2593676 RepID=UPI0035E39053